MCYNHRGSSPCPTPRVWNTVSSMGPVWTTYFTLVKIFPSLHSHLICIWLTSRLTGQYAPVHKPHQISLTLFPALNKEPMHCSHLTVTYKIKLSGRSTQIALFPSKGMTNINQTHKGQGHRVLTTCGCCGPRIHKHIRKKRLLRFLHTQVENGSFQSDSKWWKDPSLH